MTLNLRAIAYKIALEDDTLITFDWDGKRVSNLRGWSPRMNETHLRDASEYSCPNMVLHHVRDLLSVSIPNLE